MAAVGLAGWPKKALADTVDQLSIGLGQIVHKAVDGFNKDSPLRQTGYRAHRREPRLDGFWHAHAELGVIFDLLPFSCSGRRSAHPSRSVLLSSRVAHARRISNRDSTAYAPIGSWRSVA